MKIYKNVDVLTAAKNRISWIFDEFENVVVSVSGGKDSTVCYELAMAEAKKRNRLPLRVMFLDQEAEWHATIDAVREIMENPDVEPFWIQVPFKMFNATSTEEHWLTCWEAGKENLWMRPRESYSIKENIFGTDRFGKMFPAIPKALWPGQRTAFIAGVRCEESPARTVALTYSICYKWVTWGCGLGNGNVTFYPIYDLTTSDVWKAIHDNNWSYCKLYDHLYRYGVPTRRMRVSNVHHETAVWSLFVLQEIEPKTYERLVARIQGIDMAGKMGIADYFPSELPSMFGSWKEYRDYLLENLITNPEHRASFYKSFGKSELDMGDKAESSGLYRAHVSSIMCNDWMGGKLANFMAAPQNYGVAKANRHARKKLDSAEDAADEAFNREETEA